MPQKLHGAPLLENFAFASAVSLIRSGKSLDENFARIHCPRQAMNFATNNMTAMRDHGCVVRVVVASRNMRGGSFSYPKTSSQQEEII